MGKKNKGLNSEFKNNENRIFGCTSLAWIHTTKKNNLYYIDIDSDTFIENNIKSIIDTPFAYFFSLGNFRLIPRARIAPCKRPIPKTIANV